MTQEPTPGATSDGGVTVYLTERWLLPLLSVGVVLDLIISGVLVWLSLATAAQATTARHAARQAVLNSETQYAACLNTNVVRANDLQLWEQNHQLWTVILGFFTSTDPAATRFKNVIQNQVNAQQTLAEKTFQPASCGSPPKTTAVLTLTATTPASNRALGSWPAPLVIAVSTLGFDTLVFGLLLWLLRRYGRAPSRR